MKFLSTGQAAKRCGVTRETVGKWIRAGKVASRKTAGGHYRISEESLRPFLPQAQDSTSSEDSTQLDYCWNFFKREGRPSPSCRSCIVYRSKARRCFELSRLPAELGFSGVHCDGGCQGCLYFQTQWARSIRVLAITDDAAFQSSLQEDAEACQIQMRFASGPYECSALVAEFLPDFVLIDSSLRKAKREELRSSLTRDRRVPNANIIMATSRSHPSGGVRARERKRERLLVWDIIAANLSVNFPS